MDYTQTKTLMLPVGGLRPNEGQMEAIGVHANPRQISESDYQKLLKSMRDKNMTGLLPLKVYQYGGEWIVLGGNMRLRAMQELGIESVSCIVVPEGTDAETLNEIIIKDNSTYGDWDMDALANWDEPLEDWGVDLPKFEDGNESMINGVIDAASSEIATREYSDDTNYNLGNLYRQRVNDSITDKIEAGIAAGKIRPEIADVLRTRATQCSIFNFDEICKYYRSEDATEEEKELLRRLYLVFVVPREIFDNAVEYVRTESMKIFDDELMKGQTDEAD